MNVSNQVAPSADLILAQLAEAVIYADRDGIIQRWNRAAESMFGFAASEAIGSSLDLIIPEHLRAAHWRGFDAAIKRGFTRLEGRPTVTRGLHKSGDKLYVEMSFALVADESGVHGSVAVARDVTERINREREARKNSNPNGENP
ncbi:PAS domain S-box protein [Noviherbaspirillum agri]